MQAFFWAVQICFNTQQNVQDKFGVFLGVPATLLLLQIQNHLTVGVVVGIPLYLEQH